MFHCAHFIVYNMKYKILSFVLLYRLLGFVIMALIFQQIKCKSGQSLLTELKLTSQTYRAVQRMVLQLVI